MWCGCADGVCFEQQISRTGVCGSVDREVKGRRSDDNGNFKDFEVVLASWGMLQFQSTKVLRSPKAREMGDLSTKVRRSSTYYRLMSSIISYLHSQHS